VDILKIRTIGMFTVIGLMVLVGLYMIADGMMHLVEGASDSHAELALLSVGKITGNQHLIIVGIGTILLGIAAKLLWKIDIKRTFVRAKDGIKHYATPTGKKIARMMREKNLR